MDTDPLRILLVEDNPGDVFFLRRALTRMDPAIEVSTAESAEEALGLLKGSAHHPFGLVLLDINLPRMTGLDLLLEIKSEVWRTSTALMILTSSTAPSHIAAGFGRGADGYLIKPFDLDGYTRLARFIVECWNAETTMASDAYSDIAMANPLG